MNTVFRPPVGLPSRAVRLLPVSAFALILSIAAGCASTSIPQIGAIQFVDVNGASVSAKTTLPINGFIYLVADVTNDNQLLGVSWTVACANTSTSGANSAFCGVCSPAQTASGPVPQYASTGIITTYTAPPVIPKGGTVTITAHATSMPSVTTSVKLTIVQ